MRIRRSSGLQAACASFKGQCESLECSEGLLYGFRLVGLRRGADVRMRPGCSPLAPGPIGASSSAFKQQPFSSYLFKSQWFGFCHKAVHAQPRGTAAVHSLGLRTRTCTTSCRVLVRASTESTPASSASDSSHHSKGRPPWAEPGQAERAK